MAVAWVAVADRVTRKPWDICRTEPGKATMVTSQAHRAAEMASLPAQGFVRKVLPQEGIKHSRSKKGGEIRKLSTTEDVPWGCRDQFFP